jgi:hypothetical protein
MTNQMSMKLILNTSPSTAGIINDLFNHGVIADFSEDGWVLYKREWYPIDTFLERYMINEYLYSSGFRCNPNVQP